MQTAEAVVLTAPSTAEVGVGKPESGKTCLRSAASLLGKSPLWLVRVPDPARFGSCPSEVKPVIQA